MFVFFELVSGDRSPPSELIALGLHHVMEHPYTKLLNVIDNACYVRYFADPGLIYCWHGKGRVEVLNKEGACVDFFAASPDASIESVNAAIEKHHAEELS